MRDTTLFDVRLKETRSWCAAHAVANDPVASLRSPALRPRLLESSYESAVHSVCLERARKAVVNEGGRGAVEKLTSLLQAKPTFDGRLLVYFPDADLCDGAAELESRGFFDGNNCPPWDTWVALFTSPAESNSFGNVLVAWVPATFEADAAAGIDVNPEECIQWLDAALAERLGIAHAAATR
jgi:hypothetical protein